LFGDLDGSCPLSGGHPVIEGDRPVTGGGGKRCEDIRAEKFNPVPFRQQRDGVVLEAIESTLLQVGRPRQNRA